MVSVEPEEARTTSSFFSTVKVVLFFSSFVLRGLLDVAILGKLDVLYEGISPRNIVVSLLLLLLLLFSGVE